MFTRRGVISDVRFNMVRVRGKFEALSKAQGALSRWRPPTGAVYLLIDWRSRGK
jgi:hypothetical protein